MSDERITEALLADFRASERRLTEELVATKEKLARAETERDRLSRDQERTTRLAQAVGAHEARIEELQLEKERLLLGIARQAERAAASERRTDDLEREFRGLTAELHRQLADQARQLERARRQLAEMSSQEEVAEKGLPGERYPDASPNGRPIPDERTPRQPPSTREAS